MRYRNFEDARQSANLRAFIKNLGMIAAELGFGPISALGAVMPRRRRPRRASLSSCAKSQDPRVGKSLSWVDSATPLRFEQDDGSAIDWQLDRGRHWLIP
jgi:hypothetical protein